MTRAYLRRADEDGVIRAELFIGPQSFIEHGVAIMDLMSGVLDAMEEARRDHGMSVGLMISVHHHRSEAEAICVLDQIMPWHQDIIAIGRAQSSGTHRRSSHGSLPPLEREGSARRSMPEKKGRPPTCARRSTASVSIGSTMGIPVCPIPVRVATWLRDGFP